jgi:MoaA/NifB/PqqE/SkfB family radical SAM enzyme
MNELYLIAQKAKLMYRYNNSIYNKIENKFIPLEDNKNLISIITINNCNLNCYFCRGGVEVTALKEYSRFKIMSTAEFKAIVEKCIQSEIKFFDLTPAIGEPFIDKDFITKLQILEDNPNIKEYTTTTNLLLLTKEQIIHLSKLKKLILDISIYGENSEDYFKNTNRDEFNNFLAKLEVLYDNSSDLKMRFIQRCVLSDTSDLFHYINIFRINRNVNLITNEVYNVNRASKVSQNETRKRNGVCPFGPGAGGGIVTGGDVLFCPFHDFERTGVMGNIFTDSLKVIYNSNKWKEIINNHQNNNYIGMCKGCDETW